MSITSKILLVAIAIFSNNAFSARLACTPVTYDYLDDSAQIYDYSQPCSDRDGSYETCQVFYVDTDEMKPTGRFYEQEKHYPNVDLTVRISIDRATAKYSKSNSYPSLKINSEGGCVPDTEELKF